MRREFDEAICDYCTLTGMGTVSVNTGPWNLCEGLGCEEAQVRYVEEHPEEEE